MRHVIGASTLAVILVSCAHAPASRFKMNGAYTVCACDGTERQPTPSEASSFREGERVDTYCEGAVHHCHPAAHVPDDD